MAESMVFSLWFRWEQCDSVPGSDLPGVYLIAEFEDPPPGSPNPLDEHILCIGRTGADSKQKGGAYDDYVSKRCYRFKRSATTGKRAHSGGRTAYKKSLPRQWDNVYVAALQFPFPSEEPVAATLETLELGDIDPTQARRVLVASRYKTWFRQVERKLHEDFRAKHGHLPLCNKVL